MKYIKSFILVFIIIIVAIIIILLKLNDKQVQDIELSTYDNGADLTELSTEIKEVDNIPLYFTAELCLKDFFKTLHMEIENMEDDYIEGGEISYSDLIGVTNEMDRNTILYNILSSKYIYENNITINNVYNHLINLNSDFSVEKMYIIDGERIKEMYAYITENQTTNELLYRITLDVDSKTYSIEPMEMIRYDKIVKSDIQKVEKNDYNTFEYVNLTDEEMAKKYFNDYKNNLLNNPSKTYNILDKEYRERRFGNLENYEKYIEENKEQFENIVIKKYLINNYNDYIEYVCQDQYENLYIFNVSSIMNYELKLDTYTIITDTFKEEYEKASNEKRGQMNIDKFIQMINRQDYKTSYNCITESFKNNYFDTQEEFEKYIKNEFFSYNKFEFKSCEQKGNNVYVYNVQLTDLTNEDTEVRDIGIIIRLNNDFDFDMSFVI